MPQDYDICGDILNNGLKNILLMELACRRFSRAWNPLVNNPAHPQVLPLTTSSALDSYRHTLHSAALKQQILQDPLLSSVGPDGQHPRAAVLKGGAGILHF